MASKSLEILQAVEAALGAVGRPASVKTVERMRLDDLDPDEQELDAILIAPSDEGSERETTDDVYTQQLAVGVTVVAEIPDGETADEAVDPGYVWVDQVMMSGEPWGGHASDTLRAQNFRNWNQEEALGAYAALTCTYLIEYELEEGEQ